MSRSQAVAARRTSVALPLLVLALIGQVAPAAAGPLLRESVVREVDAPILPSWYAQGAHPLAPRAIFPGDGSTTTPVWFTAVSAVVASPASTIEQLVNDPRLALAPAARTDLLSGAIDPRIVAVLAEVLTRHTLSVQVLRTGHSTYVAGTTVVSNHVYGRAVDIDVVDGEPVSPASEAAHTLVLELLAAPGPLRPEELGQPWPDLVGGGVFSNAAHQNHLHLGFYDAWGGRGP